MWIGPALIVLVVLSVQMMLRWPLIGGFSLVMVGAYIAANILFSNLYVMKANRRSVALDSRIGGALADAISSNPTVKGFGAEAREEARFAERHPDWRRRDHRHLEPLHRRLAGPEPAAGRAAGGADRPAHHALAAAARPAPATSPSWSPPS